VDQAITQVESYIIDEGINLADVPALITVLEKAFGDPDCMAVAERKLESLKQTNCDFSTYCVEFQDYAADTQWNDPAKCTTIM
jgi:hypothetical protein